MSVLHVYLHRVAPSVFTSFPHLFACAVLQRGRVSSSIPACNTCSCILAGILNTIRTHCTHSSSDIRFVIGEERQTIYAHKCLLAARCEVFRAMFTVPQGEEAPTPIVLSDVKPSIFLAVLEFIYTNCCSLSTDMVSQGTLNLF